MLVRYQVVLSHKSGFPRDNVVNTFHVANVDTAAEIEACAEAIRDFYVVDPVASGTPRLAELIGAQINTNGHQVRAYTLDIPTGARLAYPDAPPEHVEAFDFVGRAAPVNSHPSEVAVCLSMRNVSQVATPPARRRGRVYLGPLEVTLTTDFPGTGNPQVHPDFVTALLAGANKLKNDIVAAGGVLVVYSRPFEGRPETPRPGRTTLPELPARPGAVFTVEQFFVDNAFDTVRRRGERATTRVVA